MITGDAGDWAQKTFGIFSLTIKLGINNKGV